MNWRRVPPVYSPVTLPSLANAAAAAVGLKRSGRAALAAELSAAFSAEGSWLTDSGTSALVLALRATVSRGETVAMPGYACIDIIAAAIGADVRIVLYDLDPETLSPDPSSVRAALQRGTRALVVAPLFGYPPDMGALTILASEHGVPLIEDAAQAAGATLGNRKLGSFGDLTVLSFGRGKGVTGGSGGALLFRGKNSRDHAVAMRSVKSRNRNLGAGDVVALAAQWLLARPQLYSIPASIPALKLGEMVYKPAPEPSGISSAAAAAVRSALRQEFAEVRSRRVRAKTLAMATAETRRFRPIIPLPDADPGYLRLAMYDLAGTATASPSIGAIRGYPLVLDEHPETQRILLSQQPALTGARALRDRLFTLPTHSRVSASDIRLLATWIGTTQRRFPEAPVHTETW